MFAIVKIVRVAGVAREVEVWRAAQSRWSSPEEGTCSPSHVAHNSLKWEEADLEHSPPQGFSEPE